MPYDKITIYQIGLLIGSTQFQSFPILQYMPYFLIGIYFAKFNINFDNKILIGSLIGTLVFFCYYCIFKSIPERFPPSFPWTVSGMFFLYTYYLFSKFLWKKNINTKFIE